METFKGFNGTIFRYDPDFEKELLIIKGDQEFFVDIEDVLEFVAMTYVLQHQQQTLASKDWEDLLQGA
jgi:hypothetical protein